MCSGSMMMTSSHTTPRCVGQKGEVSSGARGLRRAVRYAHFKIVHVMDLVKDDPFDVADQIRSLRVPH